MLKDRDHVLYTAFKSKDTRFDGRFFVGISSTGIYCRPICRAKLPKQENCNFYATAAEAEQAGYRPCLLCRPELAPGLAPVDANISLVHRAARMLEENCGSGQSIEEIADRLGCTDRHLRRVFTEAYQVSPVQYLQTCRLLMAKNLLTNTNLSVLEIAMASGFGSLRRFNDLFKKHYRLSPTALRKQIINDDVHGESITVSLGYRPPYQWQQILDFFVYRAIAGVEVVRDHSYLRTVHLITGDNKSVCGWVKVSHKPKNNTLSVTISESLLPMFPQVMAKIRYQFDLYCDPESVFDILKSMNDIHPELCVLGTRLPGCFDSFEMSVRAVLGQQITVKAAGTLAARLVEKYGTVIETGIEGLTHVFPNPEDILHLETTIEDNLGELGIINTRARAILELAEVFHKKEIDFNLCANPEKEVEKLMAIPGVGEWTAQYIVMRAMGWTDALLYTDYGVKKALATKDMKEIRVLREKWHPWGSYATVNLWNSL